MILEPTAYQKKLVQDVEDRGLERVLAEWPLGSGKSLAGLMVCQHWNDETKLVVCPKSLVNMWVSLIESQTGEMATDLTKLKPSEVPQLPLKGWNVINYDLLEKRHWLEEMKDYTMMLDESSFIKNHHAERTQAVLKLSKNTSHLMMLSGTPCGGRYEYMWSHAFLLGRRMKYKDFWDSFVNSFKQKSKTGMIFNRIYEKNPYKNIEILLEDLNEKGRFTLDPSELEKLPDKTDITISVPAPPEYRKFMKERKAEVGPEKDRKTITGNNIMAVRQGLRRIASSYNPEKLDAFRAILNSTDERVVVFYEYRDDYEALKKICREEQRPVASMNSDCRDLGKPDNVYETEDNSVCLVQWQSGGHGLNLQKARIGVFYSLPESYEQYCQARGRLMRKGQQLPVYYYTLEAEKTIDVKIAKALANKRDYSSSDFLSDFSEFSGLPKGEETKEAEAVANTGEALQDRSAEVMVPEGYAATGTDGQMFLFPEMAKKPQKIVLKKKKGIER